MLFDLEILSKEENKLFLLLMEFRNQFMHNIECTSFEKAFEFLGNDKKNQLSKYFSKESPDNYFIAYLNLSSLGIDIILEKHKNFADKIERKKEFIKAPLNTITYLIDSIFNLYDELSKDNFEINDSDSIEVVTLKLKIFNIIEKHQKATFYSEEYKELSHFTKTNEGAIKNIFK